MIFFQKKLKKDLTSGKRFAIMVDIEDQKDLFSL
jgi:hypothetical protein